MTPSAPRSRHSWASRRCHCAAVRCQGLRFLAMKRAKQTSSNLNIPKIYQTSRPAPRCISIFLLHNSRGNVARFCTNARKFLERFQAFKGGRQIEAQILQNPPLSFQGDAERQVGSHFWLGQVTEDTEGFLA